MLTRCHRNWLVFTGLGLTVAIWGIWPVSRLRAQEGAQVSISPRPKPSPKEEVRPKADIRSDVNLVLIPVTVTDPLNRFVTGLEKEYFKIYEDRKEQQITQFSSDDAPLSVGVLFDCSGSMGPKLRSAREAVAQFFKTSNPEDEAFLVEIHDTANLTVGFTNNLEEIQNHLQFIRSKGMTALLDAIYLSIHEMKKARNPRKALLIISDGGDNNSRYTDSEVHDLVKEADVQIYAIGIYEPTSTRSRTVEESKGPALLTDLAEQTGGRQYEVENLTELPDIATKIGMELRNQYLLGYTPLNQEKDGKYRHVEVKLVQPHGMPLLRAFWRMGYNAPAR
jgi:Ca-activated chloride channel homolog